MTQLILPEDLSRRLDDIARREDRPVEQVLDEMIRQYGPHDNVEKWRRDLNSKLYRMAREYWQKVGDEERLALTDDELDEQFWLFDHDDIPRLKSDQGKITLPPDPLESIAGIFDMGPTNFGQQMRALRAEMYRDKFGDKD